MLRRTTTSGRVHRGQHLVAVRLGADHPGALRPDRGQQHPGPLGHLGPGVPLPQPHLPARVMAQARLVPDHQEVI